MGTNSWLERAACLVIGTFTVCLLRPTTATASSDAPPLPSKSVALSSQEGDNFIHPAFQDMLDVIRSRDGFIAALDQSGGSTPKALEAVGLISDRDYVVGESSMYDAIHSVRSRLMTSTAFMSDRILGAILFEDTAFHRQVEGIPTPQYLWEQKRIVPFLKIDKGMQDEQDGVQLLKDIPNLETLVKEAASRGIFGTKMRSLIRHANIEGIEAVVAQQFAVAKKIISASGLIPIIEPEVDIYCPDKVKCEEILRNSILRHLDALNEDETVILKLSLPSTDNIYEPCANHPRCLRLVALSGGYSRQEANNILERQSKMIASFSRALVEGISMSMEDTEFDGVLKASIDSIYRSSLT